MQRRGTQIVVVEPRIGADEASRAAGRVATGGRSDDGSVSTVDAVTTRCTTSWSSAAVSSAARSLACCRITIWPSLFVEAGPDVGAGTSKANTAILHTGFDASPASLESRLVARGYALLRDYAPSVGHLGGGRRRAAGRVGRRTGRFAARPRREGMANGYERAEIVDRDAVLRAASPISVRAQRAG